MLKRRTLDDIFRRGRWSTWNSVKRYEKHGTMQKALANSPAGLVEYGNRCTPIVGVLLLGMPPLAPKPPLA